MGVYDRTNNKKRSDTTWKTFTQPPEGDPGQTQGYRKRRVRQGNVDLSPSCCPNGPLAAVPVVCWLIFGVCCCKTVGETNCTVRPVTSSVYVCLTPTCHQLSYFELLVFLATMSPCCCDAWINVLYLRQVALSKAVQSSLLGNCPLQGHLHHTQHIRQRILHACKPTHQQPSTTAYRSDTVYSYSATRSTLHQV